MVQSTFAWEDKRTHPTLSEFAAEKFFGIQYMDQSVNGKDVRKWIRDGAELEDAGTGAQFLDGTARSLNHFHSPTISNPTKNTLETSGLSDRANGMSALRWAQTGIYQMELGWEDWSWQKVRTHQYSYLTAINKSDENANFSKLLMGLGYQMHLLQDMGHPSHVRNNTHIIDGKGLGGFETWTAKNDTNIIRDGILNKKDLNGNPMYPITNVTVDLAAKLDTTDRYAPIARLFDTRTYLGTSLPTAMLNQGLSEYTNSNFFSQDTIFAAERYADNHAYKYFFPYPRKEGTDIQAYLNKTKPASMINYVSKSGEGEQLTYLARDGVSTRLIRNVLGVGKRFYGSFKLDEACYQDYAQKLIPRAVGYSKAMLEYFYRGKLDIEPVTASSTFQHFFIKIKNSTTTGEEMTGGEVALAIKYRLQSESGGVISPPTDTAPHYYKVVPLPGQYAISRTQQSELTFDLGSDPLPFLATDVTLQVVYRGQLGNEAGSVAVGTVALTKTGSDIALSLPASGVYATAAPNAGGFTRIAVNATSASDLNQPDGLFELVLKYRLSTSDPYQGVVVETQPADPDSFYVIRANEANGVNALQAGVARGLTFDISTTPLPLWASDVFLDVIYRRANATEEKPLAIGQLDISEPTPVDVFNNTDRVCINNQWHVSGSPEAYTAAGVDVYGDPLDDIFSHRMDNVSFWTAGSGTLSLPLDPVAKNLAIAAANPGEVTRLGYILTDYTSDYAFDEQVTPLDPRDDWEMWYDSRVHSGTGFTNQKGKGFSGMYTIRGKKMWWGASLVYDLNDESDALCGWETLPQ